MIYFITGVGSGIGKELSKLLLREGNTVIGLARKESYFKSLVDEAGNVSGRFIPFLADLTDVDIRQKTTAFLEANQIDTVDVLVNNAGAAYLNPHHAFDNQMLSESSQTLFIGPYLLTEAVIPYMKESPVAHIVNISSMAGFQDSVKFPGLTVYSALKAAVIGWTQALAAELGGSIKVNALALGAVNTPMLTTAFPDYIAPVNAPDMAEYIAGFCKEGARFYNGKVLPVAVQTP